jgi:hypothetical protein
MRGDDGRSLAQAQEVRNADAVEWIVPLPHPRDRAVVSHIRGTVLVASRDQIRASGHFDRYARCLSHSALRDVEEAVAASWLPIRLAEEHFGAIDALSLEDAEIVTLTTSAARQTQGILLTTLSRMARVGGLTVWSVAPLTGKVWERMFVGGALGLAREGPKEAAVKVVDHPLIRSRYHRLGFAQHLANAVRFVAGKRAHVRTRHVDLGSGSAEFQVQWV